MIRKLVFLFTFMLVSFLLSAQSYKDDIFFQAKQLFQNEKFGLSQQLYQKIYTDNFYSNQQKEEALFHIAICSKQLFNEDTKYWFDEFLNTYPYSSKTNAVNYELGLFYFRQVNYPFALDYFQKCDNKTNEYHFKLAYTYFVLDSLESSKYYFSKLLNTDSKYTAASQYFYAHITYKQKHFKTALAGFFKLKEDKSFASIVPYYISQIYFLQKPHYIVIFIPKSWEVATKKGNKKILRSFL